MNVKSLFIIVATIFIAWALWSGSLGVCFEKISSSDGIIILKVDKNSKAVMNVERYFHNTSFAAGKIIDTAFAELGGRELIRRCKDQPVFFGSILIVFGVFACGLIFLVHMIRTDSRFS